MEPFGRDVGELTEAAVQAAVEAAFASDFVFRSPRRDDEKEATDVLVLFGDVALVVQAKAQSSTERDPIDWARKNLKKAFNQTRGAIRAFRAGRVTSVSNPRRGVMPIDINQFPYVYGLAVLHHDSAPYCPSALVPGIATASFPMHVLSYRDFFNLVRFLDTPWDLIDYLEHRTDVLLPSLNPRVHEERDVFGAYAAGFEQIHALRAAKRGETFTVEDGRPLGEFLRRTVEGVEDQKPGALIDRLIDRIHNVDSDLAPIEVGGIQASTGRPSGYATIATALASIPRARRVALGRRAIKLALTVASTRQLDWFLSTSRRRDDCLLYMVSPRPEDERKERREELLSLTLLAKAYCGVKTAIGICTTAPGTGGGAEDYLLTERPEPPPTKEILEAGKELFGALSGRLIDS